MAILLEGMHRASRCVDGEIGKIRPSQPFYLGVEIGKIAPLKQRVVAEIDPRYYVRRAERYLFCLREEIIDAPIKHQPPNLFYRDLFLRNDFGSIEHVEREF